MTQLSTRKGNTFVRDATIRDALGQPFDLTGCTVWWTLKDPRDQSDDDADAVARLYWVDGGDASGIAVLDVTTGDVTVRLEAEATAALRPAIVYRWDLKVRDTSGDTTTVDAGTLRVDPVQTMRLTVP